MDQGAQNTDEKTTIVNSTETDSQPNLSPQPSLIDFHIAALDNVFIAISGLIGAGKSTLAAALAKRLNLPVYYEPVVNNVYLADFYRDTKKYSFPMQVCSRYIFPSLIIYLIFLLTVFISTSLSFIACISL